MNLRAAIAIVLSAPLRAFALWADGNDSTGLAIKAEMDPVIAAVRSFRDKYGALPKSLAPLIPEFIQPPPSHGALQYSASEASIGFIYSPSLLRGSVTKCTPPIDQRAWVCTDYKL